MKTLTRLEVIELIMDNLIECDNDTLQFAIKEFITDNFVYLGDDLYEMDIPA